VFCDVSAAAAAFAHDVGIDRSRQAEKRTERVTGSGGGVGGGLQYLLLPLLLRYIFRCSVNTGDYIFHRRASTAATPP